jgi:hypothetical protein
MKIKTICFSAVMLSVITSCSQKKDMDLSVNFSSRPQWNYSIEVSIGGKIKIGDSSSVIGQTLKCSLAGHPVTSDSSALDVTVYQTTLESAMLDDAEKHDIIMSLNNQNLKFSLKKGFAGLDSATAVSNTGAGQWGLYSQFARMIPVLPEGKVRPGFSWDRHSQMPVATTQGNAAASMYQSFVFDSLTRSSSGRIAHLSWKFSYTLDPIETDTAGIIDDMPHKGSGTGSAKMDIDRKIMLMASVEFVIPKGPSSDPYSIEWIEKAKLELQDDTKQK